MRVEEEERERRHTSIRHKLDLISVYNHGPGPPVDQTAALHSLICRLLITVTISHTPLPYPLPLHTTRYVLFVVGQRGIKG